MSVHRLCERCGEFNFHDAVFHRPTVPEKSLGFFDEMFSRAVDCIFCDFVTRVALQRLEGMQDLTTYNGKGNRARCFLDSHDNWSDSWFKSNSPGRCFYHYFSIRIENESFSRYNGFPKTFLLHPCAAPVPQWMSTFGPSACDCVPRMSVRQVDPLVDPGIVSAWVKLCKSHHGEDCEQPAWLTTAGWPSQLRLIDVKENRLVSGDGFFGTNHPRYVTLSYVWGANSTMGQKATTKTNVLERSQAGALLELDLPLTIQDAMGFVNDIDERFLWVDSLCIIQDDDVEVQQQISQMDLIYARAELTIVAASGGSAESGLQRYRVPHVMEQSSLQISEELSVTTLRRNWNVDEYQRCPWIGRGWTYQESLLSKRMVLFLDNQIFWRCESDVWEEETIREHLHKMEGDGKKARSARPFNQSDDLRSTSYDQEKSKFLFSHFPQMVAQYQKRNFTNECDVVDGIQGILGRMEDICTDKFHWGLPHNSFEQALLWHEGLGPLRRRRCQYGTVDAKRQPDKIPIPTWSWMAWAGDISWHGTTLVPDEYVDTRDPALVRSSTLEWFKVGKDNTLLRLERKVKPENSSVPRWKGHQSLVESVSPSGFSDSGRLMVCTSYARFKILKDTARRNPNDFDIFDHHSRTSRYNRYLTLDDSNRAVGTMYRWERPASEHENPEPAEYEFVVIAEFGRARGYAEPRKALEPVQQPQLPSPPKNIWKQLYHSIKRQFSSSSNLNEKESANKVQPPPDPDVAAFVAHKKTGIHTVPVDVKYELDVMLIEWNDDRSVAYRVEIFSILEDDWMSMKPEWKVITFG